jgi:hypothetical protein
MAFKNFRFAGSSYYNSGASLVPLSITPSDSTTTAELAMIVAGRRRSDDFDLGADPENGANAPGDVHSLQNMDGYIPQSWTKVRT